MVATTVLYPGNPVLDRDIESFARNHVDLDPTSTRYGRTLADYAMQAFAYEASRLPHLPRVYRSRSFLAGSLGRRTQEQPLSDIDVFLVFNADGTEMLKDGVREEVTMYGTSPNPLVSDSRYHDGAYISSLAVLQQFLPAARACITADGPFTEAGVGAKLRTLYLKADTINVDLVLVELGETPVLDRYYLPNGDGMWRASNPKEDQRRLSSMNQTQGGNLLTLVRLMKWWNKSKNAGRLKGIHLEVMIENALAGWNSTASFSALRLLIPALHDAVANSCNDPTGLGDPLDARLAIADRTLSQRALASDAEVIAEAGRYSDAGFDAAARDALRRIFPV